MEKSCTCTESVREGSVQGINFRLCTNCSYLQWEPYGPLSFVKPTFQLDISGLPTGKHGLTLSDLVQKVASHLAKSEGVGYSVKVDFQALKYAALSDVWINHREADEFKEIVSYADLGLPLAYAINNGVVEATKFADSLIDEGYQLLGDIPLTSSEITIPLFDEISAWEIRAAEDEEEEEYYPLVASKLCTYSTEELIRATVQDLITEQSDYMQLDTKKALESDLERLEVEGSPVQAKIVEMNLQSSLQLEVPLVVEPIVRRSK